MFVLLVEDCSSFKVLLNYLGICQWWKKYPDLQQYHRIQTCIHNSPESIISKIKYLKWYDLQVYKQNGPCH